jgi:uncharacterized repeat protein (TIGR01451 family)
MCHTINLPEGRNTCTSSQQPNAIDSDFTCDFGNQEIILNLSLTKENVLNGLVVDYSLTVTNESNQTLNTVQVIDALPGGFSYISGTSKIDGNPVSDPTQPGDGTLVWEINPFEIGSKILTYQAQINTNVPAGVYTNIAYARGTFVYPSLIDHGGQLFITAPSETETVEIIESEPVESNAATSAIALGISLSYGGFLAPQVLGTSTEVLGATLPATGSSTTLLVLALLALSLGLLLLNYKKLGVKSKKAVNKKKGKKHAKK